MNKASPANNDLSITASSVNTRSTDCSCSPLLFSSARNTIYDTLPRVTLPSVYLALTTDRPTVPSRAPVMLSIQLKPIPLFDNKTYNPPPVYHYSTPKMPCYTSIMRHNHPPTLRSYKAAPLTQHVTKNANNKPRVSAK